MKWLNSSCLGIGSTKPEQEESKSNISNEIVDIFIKLENWVIEWTGYENGVVGFVESTTAACDAVLMALSDDSQIFIHTSSAHPTIQHSIRNTAKIVAHIRKSKVDVREIDLGVISWDSEANTADLIVERVLEVVGMEKGIFVLDHVTYDHGVQLPVKVVVEKLKELRPNLQIVIDAAQSVALWRTHKLDVAAYVGCFHKYIAAPAATGFFIVPQELKQWLPPHVQTMADLPKQLDFLPTLDLIKWRQTVDTLRENMALKDLEMRISKIERFNQAFEMALSPYMRSFGINYKSNFRSHISSLTFKNENDAEDIKRVLFSKGYEVQHFGKIIRISVGKNTPLSWATEIGKIIKSNIDAMKN